MRHLTLIAALSVLLAAPSHAQDRRNKDNAVGWSLNAGVAIPLGGPLSDVATVGPALSGEVLYSVHEWISVGLELNVAIPVPLQVQGDRAPTPYFVGIYARGMFHGGDVFTYWVGLGVGLSYYGVPTCDGFCEDVEAVARFGGDLGVGIGGRVTDTLSIGPGVSFVMPDFRRGGELWFLTANVTMQWGL